MKKIETFKALNIRAEVLLAEFIELSDEWEFENLSIQPNGGFNKVVSRDILSVDEIENSFGVSKKQITVVRKGIFDALPDGLFHQMDDHPTSSGSINKSEQILESLKVRKQQEKDSRRFFSPFDQAFNRYRLLLEQEERKVLTGFPVGSRHSLFDIIWSDFKGAMTTYQKSILFSLLPLSHHIVGNQRYTELAFEAVIGLPVTITKTYVARMIQLEKQNLVLGGITLANDFVLGDFSEEKEVAYKIAIGPVPISKATDYLPGSDGDQVLQKLSDYFLPFNVQVVYDFNMETKLMTLPEKVSTDGYDRLGYTIAI